MHSYTAHIHSYFWSLPTLYVMLMLTATYPILGWPPAPYLNTISSLAMPTSVFCSMYGPLWLPTVVYKMNRAAHCVFLPRSDTTASFVAWWGPIIWSGRQHHLISTPSSLAMPKSVLCSMYGPLWLPTVVYKMNRAVHCVFLPTRSDTTASFWPDEVWDSTQSETFSP